MISEPVPPWSATRMKVVPVLLTRRVSGRRANGECQRSLANRKTGAAFIGTGSRVAAVTAQGQPQVVDLATGRTVWTSRIQWGRG